jgi:hypothetical protein
MPNFVSGFTSEYEHLANLVVFSEEVVKMYTSAELNALGRGGEAYQASVMAGVNEAARSKGIDREFTAEEAFFRTTPAQMAEVWWIHLQSRSKALTPASLAESFRTGIDERFLEGILTQPHRPVEK